MSIEYSASSPVLQSEDLRADVWEGYETISDRLTASELELCNRIVLAARQVCPAVCNIPDNKGKSGFAVTITKNEPGFPMLSFIVGSCNDPDSEYGADGKTGKYIHYSRKKAEVIQTHPDFTSSGQNAGLPESEKIRSVTGKEIPAGAVRMGEWVISVSAFKEAKHDTASALAIGAAAGVKKLREVEALAVTKEVDCREFIKLEDRILPKSAYR